MPTGLKTNVNKGKRGSNIWIIYYRVSGLSHIFRIAEFELQKVYIVTCILCLFLSQNVNFYLIIFKTITARKKLIAWSVSCGWFSEDLTCSWNFPFIVNIVMSSWISNEGKVNGVFYVGKWTPWIKFPDILRISEFQKEIQTVKAMLCITNNGLKKKKIHFRQDHQRNNQKYGELVALCGGGDRAYSCLGPFLQISEFMNGYPVNRPD